MEESIGEKKKFLASLRKALIGVKIATKPIQEQLAESQLPKPQVDSVTAKLPGSLLNVYLQLRFAKDVLGWNFELEVLHDEGNGIVEEESECQGLRDVSSRHFSTHFFYYYSR